MAIESVDILTLLKRARKSVAASAGQATQDEQQASAVAVETEESNSAGSESAATPPAPRRAVFQLKPQIDEQAELEFIKADLYSDEILLQRILGMLYRQKKDNPFSGFISILDMERILGMEREGGTFIMSYMKTHRLIEMDDKSRMAITVPGIDYLRKVFGIHASPTFAEPAQETESQPAEKTDD